MAFDYEAKIAALLTKAEAKGTTPEEAEALSDAAERLMMKFGIDRATAAAKKMAAGGRQEEGIITESIHFTGEYREAYATLCYAVVSAMGNVRGYRSAGNFSQTRRTGLHSYIVGYESDAKAAKVLVQSLVIQAVNALNVWVKSGGNWALSYGTPTEKRRARYDFLSSFGSGAAQRIRLARQTVEGDAVSSEPGTALVLRDRSKALDDFLAPLGLKSSARSRKADWSAREAGNEAGRRANTGDTQVGNSRIALH